MSFDPDTAKQAQEVIFIKKKVNRSLLFNNASVTRISSRKHLQNILDNQVNSDDHAKMVSGKISKTKGHLGKLQNFLPRAALLTIYKAVIRHHLDYGDILYDHAYNKSFHQKQ